MLPFFPTWRISDGKYFVLRTLSKVLLTYLRYLQPVAQSKLSENPPKKAGEIFIALLPPHKQPKDCVSDDILLLTAKEVLTVLVFRIQY